MSYKFELKFDCVNRVNVGAVQGILDAMTKVESHASPALLDVLMQIDGTRMTRFSSELNEAVKQMLRMLTATSECYVLYSVNDCVYTVSRVRQRLEHLMVEPYILIGIEEDERQYTCFWGEGYEPRTPETVDINFFSEANGYHSDEAMTIAELNIGEAATFNDYGFHSIVRVK